MAFNIGNLLGSAASAFGGPWGAVGAGLLGGLFGGGEPQLPKELRDLYRIQKRSALGMEQFANSVPMSGVQEQSALAQQRALLGQAQGQQRDYLFSSLSPDATTSTGDLLRNLSTQQLSQQSALTSQHFLNSLAARRQALLGAANIAQGAVGAASQYQQQPDIGGLLAQLAQSFAYRRSLRPQTGGGGWPAQGIPTQRPSAGGGWVWENK